MRHRVASQSSRGKWSGNVSQPRAARYPYRTIEFNRRVIASPIRSPLPRQKSSAQELREREWWSGSQCGPDRRSQTLFVWLDHVKRREPTDDNHDHTSGWQLQGIDRGYRDQCGRLAPQRMQQLQCFKKFFPRSGDQRFRN
jgi:hypothetical protein